MMTNEKPGGPASARRRRHHRPAVGTPSRRSPACRCSSSGRPVRRRPARPPGLRCRPAATARRPGPAGADRRDARNRAGFTGGQEEARRRSLAEDLRRIAAALGVLEPGSSCRGRHGRLRPGCAWPDADALSAVRPLLVRGAGRPAGLRPAGRGWRGLPGPAPGGLRMQDARKPSSAAGEPRRVAQLTARCASGSWSLRTCDTARRRRPGRSGTAGTAALGRSRGRR